MKVVQDTGSLKGVFIMNNKGVRKMATSKDIKKYREDAIKMMIDDIKYFESLCINEDDLWDNINLCNYSYYSTEEDKVKAFQKAGYTVEFD